MLQKMSNCNALKLPKICDDAPEFKGILELLGPD